MAQFYATQIKLKKITLEEVPELWREEVRRILEAAPKTFSVTALQ